MFKYLFKKISSPFVLKHYSLLHSRIFSYVLCQAFCCETIKLGHTNAGFVSELSGLVGWEQETAGSQAGEGEALAAHLWPVLSQGPPSGAEGSTQMRGPWGFLT